MPATSAAVLDGDAPCRLQQMRKIFLSWPDLVERLDDGRHADGAEREPQVPMPICTLSVSPWTIETESIGTPKRSDTSWANVVSWPWLRLSQ